MIRELYLRSIPVLQCRICTENVVSLRYLIFGPSSLLFNTFNDGVPLQVMITDETKKKKEKGRETSALTFLFSQLISLDGKWSRA